MTQMLKTKSSSLREGRVHQMHRTTELELKRSEIILFLRKPSRLLTCTHLVLPFSLIVNRIPKGLAFITNVLKDMYIFLWDKCLL